MDLTSLACGVFADVLGAPVGPDDDFFAAGGDSLAGVLALVAFEERLGVALAPTDLRDHPTPRALAAVLDRALAARAAPAAPAATGRRRGPTSAVQRGALATAAEIASRGFIYWVYQLNGRLDEPALARAVDEVVERHDVLRTHFEPGPDGLDQVVDPFVPGVLRVLEQPPLPKPEALDAAVAAVRSAYAALSPEADAAFRATLHRVAPKTAVLAMFVGEALLDGEGGNLVAAEISRAYARHAGHPEPDLATPPAAGSRFLDHVAAHPLPEQVARAAAEHWAGQAALPLPAPRWPVARTGTVATATFELGPAEWDPVAAAARVLRVTPYVVTLAGFQTALARLGVADHLLVGAAVSNRTTAATERMVGTFASPVRIEAHVAPGDRFRDVVARSAGAVRAAIAHSAVPAPPPLPAVEFFMFDERSGLDLPGVRQRRFRLHSTQAALTLNCWRGSTGAQRFSFSSATAPADRLEALADAVHDALVTGVADPDLPVARPAAAAVAG